MQGRRPLLALSLPLALGGCLVGHLTAYGAIGESPGQAALHGYLAYAPLTAALAATTALVALALRAHGRLRGAPSAAVFALLAPLAFVLQETIERAAQGVSLATLVTAPVLVGLLAQLPLAAVAFVLAHALLAVADAIGRLLAAAPPAARGTPSPRRRAARVTAPRPAVAHAGFGRAPPPA